MLKTHRRQPAQARVARRAAQALAGLRAAGEELEQAKRDATLLWLKRRRTPASTSSPTASSRGSTSSTASSSSSTASTSAAR